VEQAHPFLQRRQVRAQHGPGVLAQALRRPFGPARLLGLVGGELRRHLARHGDVHDIAKAPALQKGAVAEIEILSEGVRRPATRVLDDLPPPDAARAVHRHRQPGAAARHLLDGEVLVDRQYLGAREQVIAVVEMRQARLHQGDARIGVEVGHRAPQEIGRGDEIGVEHADAVRCDARQPMGQRPGLVPGPVRPVNQLDGQPPAPPFAHFPVEQGGRLVRGVVQHLYGELVAGVVDRADGIDQPLDDVPLIEDRKLKGDRQQLVVGHVGRGGRLVARAQVERDQDEKTA